MTQEAYELIDRDLSQQHARQEARRIRIRVNEIRKNPHAASLRWPFELLQNALDAGPRSGSSVVTVRLRSERARLIFEHDGTPFTSKELAALLAGGSSKEFESDITTGRFGTGLLVTHVLAERVTLRGLLKVSTGHELFELKLDRSGDEESILANTKFCNEALKNAKPIGALEKLPSASFEYSINDDEPVRVGFEALREALPYIFVTRPFLGHVQIKEVNGAEEIWTPGEISEQSFEGVSIEGGYLVEYRTIHVRRNGTSLPELRAYRFSKNRDAGSAALIVVEQSENRWRVRSPGQHAPKIYREYPLRGSGFVPINFVLDGKFDPDQERSRLLMSDHDKSLLDDAFVAAVIATEYASDENWLDAHVLACANVPLAAFDPTSTEERKWWTDILTGFAELLAELPIIQTSQFLLPAITADDSRYANFVVPRLLDNSAADETTVERLWPLIAACTELFPPREDLALDWTRIAEGWHSLGLNLSRITLEELVYWVIADSAERPDELRVYDNPTEWLACFLDVVGECWSNRSGVELSILSELIPDQNKQLRAPAELYRDDGVSVQLKDICESIGQDIRGRLLLSDLERIAAERKLNYFPAAINKAIQKSLSEAEVIEEAIKYLCDALPDGDECDQASINLQHGIVRILNHLWKSQGANAASVARKLPLVTSDGCAVRWSRERTMMAPVSNWHPSARPFAAAYPPQRVLAQFFAGDPGRKLPNVVPALVEFGMAIADPITIDSPVELKGPRLGAISLEDADGIVVNNERFSQIALLHDVLNRCQEGVDEARSLLGLVLCHIAPHDPAWRRQRLIKGRKNKQDVEAGQPAPV
jgi:hypothetical protein